MKYLLHLFLVCCAASSVAQSNPDSWVYWGKNNTFSTGSSLSDTLIGGIGNIGSIDSNFWTGGLTPVTAGYIGVDITSDKGTCSFITGTPTSRTFCVSCSAVYPTTIKQEGNQLSAKLQTITSDTCSNLKEWEYRSPVDAQEYKEQYDTLRLYIEKCAAIDPESYTAFSSTDGAVQFMNDDTTRYDTYRDWLISVLYLNTTFPGYFCTCLGSIAGTYHYGKYNLPNARLAVLEYLRSSPHCGGPGLDDEINSFINDRHTTWLATDQKVPEDTTIPPLDSIGLGILLQHTGVVSPGTLLSTFYLASFTSNPNPFIGETSLEFTLNRMSYVTLAVYDELGRLVWGDGKGSSLEAGMHSIQIDGSKLPSGTLYARISTGFGEVKTVKLVHEK